MQNLITLLSSNLIPVHIICCFFLTGLIWTIQIVHYPSFRFINPNAFIDFVQFHGFRVSLLVVLLMCMELLTAFLILFSMSEGVGSMAMLNLVMVVAIWASTFLLSVPLHTKLAQGFDLETINLLVLTNWPRTLIWTMRSIFFAGLLGVRYV